MIRLYFGRYINVKKYIKLLYFTTMRNKKAIAMLLKIMAIITFIFIVLKASLYTVAANFIKYTNKIELDSNLYFTGELFGIDVFGIKSSSGVFNTKLFDGSFQC